MAPVQSNADSAPSTQVPAHTTLPGTLDETPRQLLTQDGLHVASQEREARDKETLLRERSLQSLLSSARHEVRSPLQSIQGFAELLAAESYGTLGEEQRVFVQHIIQSGLDLSRAVDACFELVQLSLQPSPREVVPTRLLTGLEDALRVAVGHTPLTLETQLQQLPMDLCIELDGAALNKAVAAVVTALAPLTRGKLCVGASLREGRVEIAFGPSLADGRIVWRTMSDPSRRSSPARSLLWLRLASVLFERAAGRLETSEGYERVRVLFSLPE